MIYFALGVLWVLNLYFAVTLLSADNAMGLINLLALLVLSVSLGMRLAQDLR